MYAFGETIHQTLTFCFRSRPPKQYRLTTRCSYDAQRTPCTDKVKAYHTVPRINAVNSYAYTHDSRLNSTQALLLHSISQCNGHGACATRETRRRLFQQLDIQTRMSWALVALQLMLRNHRKTEQSTIGAKTTTTTTLLRQNRGSPSSRE